MKTIALSAELTSLAMETANQHLTPPEWMGKVKNTLSNYAHDLGRCKAARLNTQKALGKNMRLQVYRLDYEKSTLVFELIRYNPRGEWEVKGFRFT